MSRHILFITSTNLASNPRCRKEINVALELQYKVTYIAFNLPNWTREKERQIENELKEVKKIYLSTGRERILSWGISTVLELLLRKAYKFITTASLISIAISRRSLQLMWELSKLQIKPDLVIAHNPAAFYPVYYFAMKNHIPFAIDIEDYHPGEGKNKVLSKLNIQLLQKVLPFARYVSLAAPLIETKIASDLVPARLKSGLIINNVFPAGEFVKPLLTPRSGKVKLVWFSQNIDAGRGLEEILPVIENLQDYFEITLIGNVREAFYSRYLKNKKHVSLIPSLNQLELNQKMAEYDVGLAIETGDADENRNICLTNKIWTYFQAALFIVASDTDAQKDFLKEHSQHGILVNLKNEEHVKQELMNVYLKRELISDQKRNRFEQALAWSWETESEKLKIQWEKMVGH